MVSCQLASCDNVGVSGCSRCGKFVCGKHITDPHGYRICTSCRAEEATRKAESDAAAARHGCQVGIVAIVVLIVGGVLYGINERPGGSSSLALTGVGLLILGVILVVAAILAD